jgi:hypothetical protein
VNYPIFPQNDVPLNSIDQTELPPLKPGLQISSTKKTIQSLADLISPQQIPVLLIGEVESYGQLFGQPRIFIHFIIS